MREALRAALKENLCLPRWVEVDMRELADEAAALARRHAFDEFQAAQREQREQAMGVSEPVAATQMVDIADDPLAAAAARAEEESMTVGASLAAAASAATPLPPGGQASGASPITKSSAADGDDGDIDYHAFIYR